jgi:hypothetical protein
VGIHGLFYGERFSNRSLRPYYLLIETSVSELKLMLLLKDPHFLVIRGSDSPPLSTKNNSSPMRLDMNVGIFGG